MNTIENEALDIAYDLPELTQGHMEDFWRNRRAILNDIDGEPSGSEVNGAIVRALARLEWLEGLEEADVSGMSPAAVMFIAAEFSRLVQEAYAIPGE